jgi:hypothetical protein
MRIGECAPGRLVALAGLVAALTATSTGQSKVADGPPVPLAKFLATYVQFSTSDVAALGRGSMVAKTLQAGESREVAVAAAVRFAIPADYYLTRLRDIATFKLSEDVLQLGVFGPSAAVAEAHAMTLEPRDIEDLRKCAAGHCKVKLDVAAIDRFRKDVTWSVKDAGDQANRVAREVVTARVVAYQEAGNAALVEYGDREPPVRLADGVGALMKRSPFLPEAFPALRDYLETFPRAPVPHAEDIFYWSKEVFGLKPVVSVTHMTIWRGTSDVADAVVTSKQIYATHYFDASLGVTLLAGDPRPGPPGLFVIYINRSLIDVLQGGLLGPIKRSVSRSKARGGLADHLEALKKRLEAEYKSAKFQS